MSDRAKLFMFNKTPAVNNDFVFVVKSDNAGTSASDQFTIPTSTDGNTIAYDYNISTSDGYTAFGVTGNHTITFPSGSGTYTVTISGDFPRIYFENGGDKLKLISISNLGSVGWTSFSGAFFGYVFFDFGFCFGFHFGIFLELFAA
jgi:hypothetical protein